MVQQMTGASALTAESPVSSPTFSGPNCWHRSKNFSDTSALTGAVYHDRPASGGDRPGVGGERDQRLPRAGRRGEDHVGARQQLEDRLLLVRVQRRGPTRRPTRSSPAAVRRRPVGTGRKSSESGRHRPSVAAPLPVDRAMFQPGELSPRVRNLAAAVIQRSWEWICAVGATSPDDAHGRRFRSMGHHSMIAFPPGALFNQHWIEIGDQTLIGPHVSMSVGMFGEDLDPEASAGPPHRASVQHRPRCVVRRPGRHRHRRRRHDRPRPVRHRPQPRLRRRHATRSPTSGRTRHRCVSGRVAGSVPASWCCPARRSAENVTVAAGSVVRGDIPDRSVVAGVPGRVVRRHVGGRVGSAAAGTSQRAPRRLAAVTETGCNPADG